MRRQKVSTMYNKREYKLHVYGKRQVENFSKIENEQIKTAQKILMDKKLLIYV